jgi:hypothetical protein
MGQAGPVLKVRLDVETAADAVALADYLKAPGRERAAVVVTRATGAPGPYINAAELGEELKGLADVFEIKTLEASWAFSEHMVPMTQVYGGAGRVYPVGTEWEANPYISPLRFAWGAAEGPAATRALLADAMRLSVQSRTVEAKPVADPEVTGQVMGIVAGYAWVKLNSHRDYGVIWPELVQHGLEAERLFRAGMKVSGRLDRESGRLDVSGSRRDPAEALASYPAPCTVLAKVAAVDKRGCELEFFPGWTKTFTAEEIFGERLDLRDLMSVGEVVPVWYGGHDGDDWRLSLTEADSVERAAEAPSLLPGGPPWLVPAEPAAAPAVAPAAEPDQAPQLELSQQTLDALLLEKQQVAELLAQANAEVATLKAELQKARTSTRELARGRDSGRLFEDPADQLRWEVEDAWARMIPAGEKAAHPLGRWSFGPDFLATLEALQGVSRHKVVEVIVQVLTRMYKDLASRDLHQLRTGPGGGDPPRVREDGATAWRVSLQVATPSARRLHDWLCADNSSELASVRLHDDYRT